MTGAITWRVVEHRILISRKLKEEFDNGEPYYPLAGKEIWLPPAVDERPRAEFLEWHADEVFRG
jgi:putative restriction endonuclease